VIKVGLQKLKKVPKSHDEKREIPGDLFKKGATAKEAWGGCDQNRTGGVEEKSPEAL